MVDPILNVLITDKNEQKRKSKGQKLLKVMDMSAVVTVIMMMLSWLHACVQTHQIVYIKYM